jgi:hypothetical protein
MELRRQLWLLAVGIALGVFGCASLTTFPYQWYGLQAASYNGTLLGPTPADDQALALCNPVQPSPQPSSPPHAGACVVMVSSEFYRLKADYETLENSLSDCQAGN